jgi:hypothetical protein
MPLSTYFLRLGLSHKNFRVSTQVVHFFITNIWQEWDNVENRRKFFEKYAKDRGFDPLNPENWYLQTSQSVRFTKV